MIDADLEKVPKETLQEMIKKAKQATKNGKAAMFLAGYQERGGKKRTEFMYSGNRAFSLPAAWKLRSTNLKSIPKRYGLEVFLNRIALDFGRLFTLDYISKEPFIQRPYRETKHSTSPCKDIGQTEQGMAKKAFRNQSRIPKIEGFAARRRRHSK